MSGNTKLANTSVPYPMPEATAHYLEEVFGNRDADLSALIHAAHEILAGGKVEVSVTAPGDAHRVAELDAILAASLKASNEINAEAGVYMTLSA